MAENQSDGNPGNGRAGNNITTDSIPEEKSVTTRIRHAKQQEQDLGRTAGVLLPNSARLLAAASRYRRPKTKTKRKDEDDDEEDDDEDDEKMMKMTTREEDEKTTIS